MGLGLGVGVGLGLRDVLLEEAREAEVSDLGEAVVREQHLYTVRGWVGGWVGGGKGVQMGCKGIYGCNA